MRIAIFTDTYHPSIDGVVRSIDNFSRQLIDDGHELKVFAPAPAQKSEQEKEVFYSPSFTFFPYPQYRVPYLAMAGLDGAKKELQDFDPDVIHCHAMAGMAVSATNIANQTDTPIVGTFHTMLPRAVHYIVKGQGLQQWASHLSWRYLRWLYSRFDVGTAPSKKVIYELEDNGFKDIRLLASPVDTKKFCEGEIDPRVRAWIPEDIATVLFLGRIAREKNLDYIIDLAREREFQKLDARILIAGKGPYKDEMQKKVLRFGLEKKIVFCGRVDESLVPSFYRAARCTLFPSRFETQGLVALESMACGTPVCAMEKTALEEVVFAGRNGGLISDDPKSSALVIKEVIEKRQKYSREAVLEAKKYSLEQCTKRLEKIYREAIDEKKKRMRG